MQSLCLSFGDLTVLAEEVHIPSGCFDTLLYALDGACCAARLSGSGLRRSSACADVFYARLALPINVSLSFGASQRLWICISIIIFGSDLFVSFGAHDIEPSGILAYRGSDAHRWSSHHKAQHPFHPYSGGGRVVSPIKATLFPPRTSSNEPGQLVPPTKPDKTWRMQDIIVLDRTG